MDGEALPAFPVQLRPGVDVVVCKAYIRFPGGGLVDYGDYILVQRDEEWVFYYPHLQRRLERETRGLRAKGYQLVMLQTFPPVPEVDGEVSIKDFDTEPYDEEEIL